MRQAVDVAQVEKTGHALDGVKRSKQVVDPRHVARVLLHLQHRRFDVLDVLVGLFNETLEELQLSGVDSERFGLVRRLALGGAPVGGFACINPSRVRKGAVVWSTARLSRLRARGRPHGGFILARINRARRGFGGRRHGGA